MQAQTHYLEACSRFQDLQGDVDGLLAQRDEAILGLLARPGGEASQSVAAVEQQNGSFSRISMGMSAAPE